VNHGEFKEVWSRALREVDLPSFVARDINETLDLRTLARTCESYVEPLGGQDAEPFNVTCAFSWVWDALLTARMATTEEDLLTEVFGRDHGVRTERPWLRVDARLRASLPYGKPIALPSVSVWAAWSHEVMTRLEHIEPLVPEETTRTGRGGRLEVLGWQGEPEAELSCGPGGELRVKSVEVSSWQTIELPRQWDNPDREPDPGPERQLHAMFGRVKAALHAWTEALDHLRPRV
jgi:hypothetical protein